MQNETKGPVAEHSMTPLRAVMTLAGVAVAIGIFLAICHFLHIEQYWPAFMFVLYWGMIDGAEVGKLRASMIGGAMGLLVGYSASLLAPVLGESSGLVFLGLILCVIYCQLMGLFVVAVNPLTMIYLTICTIPAVTEGTRFVDSIAGFALGVVFFGGLIGGGQMLKSRSASGH